MPGCHFRRKPLSAFSTAERTAIILPANEQLSLGTFELQIGALTETVTTTAETTLVQTASSVRSAMLTDTQLERLAVRGRDVISMLRVLPGVSLTTQSEAVGGSLGTTTPNIGGGRNTWNNPRFGQGRCRRKRQAAPGLTGPSLASGDRYCIANPGSGGPSSCYRSGVGSLSSILQARCGMKKRLTSMDPLGTIDPRFRFGIVWVAAFLGFVLILAAVMVAISIAASP